MCVGSDALFFILLLCRIMDIAYCMAITLISSNVCLMFILGIFNIFSILFIKGVCVAALALAVMTISGSIFQPLLIILSINGLYFCFSSYSFIWYFVITVVNSVHHIIDLLRSCIYKRHYTLTNARTKLNTTHDNTIPPSHHGYCKAHAIPQIHMFCQLMPIHHLHPRCHI